MKKLKEILLYSLELFILLAIIISVSIEFNKPDKVEQMAILNLENIDINKSAEYKKYYYMQLGDTAKKIYTGLELSKDKMKSGNYKIVYGDIFNEILSKDDGMQVLGNAYQSAVEAYFYDHPEVFYIDPNKMTLNIETSKGKFLFTTNCSIEPGDGIDYYAYGFTTEQEVNTAQEQIKKVIDYLLHYKTNNAYTNVKLVHDYLVRVLSYDIDLKQPGIYSIYAPLTCGKAVCEGYAKTFKYIMDAFDIPTVIVVGKARNSKNQVEEHSWNYVYLNGIWYAIDVTWDDPIADKNVVVSQKSKYKYFLKTEKEFNKDHFPSGRFSENGMEFKYPKLKEE